MTAESSFTARRLSSLSNSLNDPRDKKPLPTVVDLGLNNKHLS